MHTPTVSGARVNLNAHYRLTTDHSICTYCTSVHTVLRIECLNPALKTRESKLNFKYLNYFICWQYIINHGISWLDPGSTYLVLAVLLNQLSLESLGYCTSVSSFNDLVILTTLICTAMDIQELPANIGELCRICATCTSSIIRHYIFEKTTLNIPQKISACLPIVVSEEDNLSKFVCGECVYKLELLNDFRDVSIKTDRYLKSLSIAPTFKQVENFTVHQNNHEKEILLADQSLSVDLQDFVQCDDTNKAPAAGHVHCEKMIENCPTVQHVQARPASRPVRAVRLASEVSYNSDSILESLLIQKSSAKERNKKSSRQKKTILKQCKYCKLVLTSQEYFSHIAEEHKQEFECNTCRNRFSCAEDLEEHKEMADHSMVEIEEEEVKNAHKALQCNTCQKTYTRKHLLILHLRRHTGERPFPCNLCDKKYACKSSLNSHLLKHKEEWKHVCNFCGKGFVDKHSFVYHVRSNHTGERPFVCEKCDKKFIKKQDLLKHEQTQHSEMPKELFSCEKCGRVCKDYDALRSHKRSHIPVESRRVHKCTLCVASFTGKTGLMKHMHRHTGEMPYECDQCAKRFFTKKGLELHLVIHSGVKSFVCEYCGRAFSQDNTLRVHRRTHTGERPYECNVCFKRFTQSSALNSHKKLHSKDT